MFSHGVENDDLHYLKNALIQENILVYLTQHDLLLFFCKKEEDKYSYDFDFDWLHIHTIRKKIDKLKEKIKQKLNNIELKALQQLSETRYLNCEIISKMIAELPAKQQAGIAGWFIRNNVKQNNSYNDPLWKGIESLLKYISRIDSQLALDLINKGLNVYFLLIDAIHENDKKKAANSYLYRWELGWKDFAKLVSTLNENDKLDMVSARFEHMRFISCDVMAMVLDVLPTNRLTVLHKWRHRLGDGAIHHILPLLPETERLPFAISMSDKIENKAEFNRLVTELFTSVQPQQMKEDTQLSEDTKQMILGIAIRGTEQTFQFFAEYVQEKNPDVTLTKYFTLLMNDIVKNKEQFDALITRAYGLNVFCELCPAYKNLAINLVLSDIDLFKKYFQKFSDLIIFLKRFPNYNKRTIDLLLAHPEHFIAIFTNTKILSKFCEPVSIFTNYIVDAIFNNQTLSQYYINNYQGFCKEFPAYKSKMIDIYLSNPKENENFLYAHLHTVKNDLPTYAGKLKALILSDLQYFQNHIPVIGLNEFCSEFPDLKAKAVEIALEDPQIFEEIRRRGRTVFDMFSADASKKFDVSPAKFGYFSATNIRRTKSLENIHKEASQHKQLLQLS